MAPGFPRSISLPLSPTHKKASYHVRSVSLPCRSHPLISNLEEQIRATRSWAATAEGSLAWIDTGLMQIELLHTALEDFLLLSQTQETLQQSASVDLLLDDLLQQIDTYNSFVSIIVDLKQCNSEVQSAVRQQDEDQMVSSLRSQRQVEKEMTRLTSILKGLSKCRHFGLASDAKELEIAGIVMEAISATAFASMAIFTGIHALSAKATTALKPSKNLMVNLFAKKRPTEEEMNTLEILQEFENCIRNVEFCSERVFRSLICIIVSILNITTPSL
ncbi:hypothetical protein LUZ63_009269 [Rhynchospora breviuscula]|uniref:Uncharacterized protein n=1 Tax=Rhynchospora breviuscula TaxID=2022672 RepID=A0A9Q0CES5_9POAL|nr:hypothetical protein LUZ63_009269 [Rhynchospora breviuscula]